MTGEYRYELDFITSLMYRAYRAEFENGHTKVSGKFEFDVVTDADVAIERAITEAIRKEFPHDGIHGEETSPQSEICGRTWVIDPIDGTFNMSRGLDMYGMQCALICDGVPVLGVICFPEKNEIYTAIAGQGAFLNGRRIHTVKRELKSSVISFGDFQHRSRCARDMQSALMRALCEDVAKIRMFGASSIDFSCVCSGKTDAAVVFTKNRWDLLPGIVLCKEAGAVICGIDGGEYTSDSEGVVVAASEELSERILNLLFF